MISAHSIGSAGAAGYAAYLEGLTVAPEVGDYYLGRDGSPIEAPGRWLGDAGAYANLGIDVDIPVSRADLEALMAGKRPGSAGSSGDYLRRAGPDGTRAAGIDVTFSAPKSVSVAWALADGEQRATLEHAHQTAVTAAVRHLRDTVPLTTQRVDGMESSVPDTAAHLLAAEFRHSTARGVDGRLPDPQLHSHVLITSVVRKDGQVAAVRSRPVFQAAER